MPSKTKKSTTKTAKPKITKKGGMSTAAASATGAAVGAVVGGVAGAALTSDKAQEVVGDVVDKVGEYASDAMQAAKEKKDKLQETTSNVASDVIDKAAKDTKK